MTSTAKCGLVLQQNIYDLHRAFGPIERVMYEQPIVSTFRNKEGQMVVDMPKTYLVMTLAGAIEMICLSRAMQIPCEHVGNTQWRRHFLGKMPRATKSEQLKGMAVARCRQLGIDVIRHDAAEAVGILDYMLDAQRIMPPWRKGEVLRAPLAVAG